MLTASSRAGAFAGILLLVAQLTGCATMPDLELAPHHGTGETLIAQVPFIEQRRQQCGAASLAMVLNYRGEAVTARELEPYVYLPDREGAVSLEVVAQSRRFGKLAYQQSLTPEQLMTEIQAGNPAIVLLNLGLSWLPQWHFAVVTGYDLQAREFILHSGNTANHRMAFDTFYNTWARAEFWSLLVMPPGSVPATADIQGYLQAASALEQVGQLPAAGKAYQAMLRRWSGRPETEIARLGLANIAYRERNLVAARHWLLDSVKQGVATGFTWNNLAYVLADLGCADAARRSLACAVDASADNPGDLASSGKDIDLLLQGKGAPADQQVCVIPGC